MKDNHLLIILVTALVLIGCSTERAQHIAGSKDNAAKEQQFFVACREGDSTSIRQLLADGISVNATDRAHDGATALLMACSSGSDDAVSVLVDAGADVTMATAHGNTPMHVAAIKGMHRSIMLLALRGARVNAVSANMGGVAPIHLAAMHGHIKAVLALFVSGADLNLADPDGFTALHYAAREGYLNVVDVLVNEGKVDLMLRDRRSRSAEDVAREFGHPEIAQFLIAKRAK